MRSSSSSAKQRQALPGASMASLAQPAPHAFANNYGNRNVTAEAPMVPRIVFFGRGTGDELFSFRLTAFRLANGWSHSFAQCPSSINKVRKRSGIVWFVLACDCLLTLALVTAWGVPWIWIYFCIAVLLCMCTSPALHHARH